MKEIIKQYVLNIMRGTLLIILFMSCFGCHSKQKQKDLVQYVQNLKRTTSSKADKTLPQRKPHIKETYHSSHLSSPFKEKTLDAVTQKKPKQKATALPTFPLDYPLKQLKLVGILHKNNQLGAIIKTPTNRYIRIIKGSKIGQKTGVVSNIFYNKIEIQEKERMGNGAVKYQRHYMTLSKQKGT